MPIVESSYRAPLLVSNPHVNTVLGALVPVRCDAHWSRERIETADGDFLDLDWARSPGSSSELPRKLVIVSHGLEGSSRSKPVRAVVAEALARGWEVLAWNYRGCSGEPNRTLRSYHSGATEDLLTVVNHASRSFEKIALVGISLGGNLTLKFLGEQGPLLEPYICAAAVVAAPCDLAACARRLAAPDARVYMQHFLKQLRAKMEQKKRQFPDLISLEHFQKIRTFYEYDDRYTAPLHGFAGADEYYSVCSATRYLHNISVPSLLLNAADDPFLDPSCSPVAIAEQHTRLWLETPTAGGHVAFIQASLASPRWFPERAMQFIEEC